jgi:outer membrane protein assembly factor BamD
MSKAVFTVVAALSALTMSCSEFKRIEKSEDWRVKYEAGVNYYNNNDFYRSAVLFEQVQPIVRGLPEGEKVEFYLAYCQYNEKTYLLASNQFKTFYETYGRSPLREEAQFMHAYSLFVSCPDFNFDQTSSIETMEAMQNFMNQHPESTFRDKANEVVNTCQQKLEMKAYVSAKQYLKLGYYTAAIVTIDNFKKHFPDSKYIEELAFLKFSAEYQLAEKSIYYRQLERYRKSTDYYRDLVDNFPKSTYLKEAERIYADCLAKINKIKPSNS